MPTGRALGTTPRCKAPHPVLGQAAQCNAPARHPEPTHVRYGPGDHIVALWTSDPATEEN
jgi:hypothetical protein